MPSLSKDSVDDETDQVLQAVILADSFNKRFKPLTTDRPKVQVIHPFSLHCLNRLASVFFPSAMPHYWIGHLRALLSQVYRKCSSYAVRMLNKLK